MNGIKKIDIHAHVTVYPDIVPKLQTTGQRMLNPEELLSIYEERNISQGVLLPIVSPEGLWYPMTTENCIVAAQKYPDRFYWFCNIDPRAATNRPNSDLVYLLEHYKALGAKGVGEITAQLYVDDPLMDNLFSACEICDLPVLIHIAPQFGGGYGIVDALGLPRLEQMLRKHPHLKIIGHSQPFWGEISADLWEDARNTNPSGKVTEGRVWQLMHQYDNLYCDLSAGSGSNAMMRDPENAVRFLNTFSDRIFYGCDCYALDNKYPAEFDHFLDKLVYHGKLDMEVYTKIVRGNAKKILKLDVV